MQNRAPNVKFGVDAAENGFSKVLVTFPPTHLTPPVRETALLAGSPQAGPVSRRHEGSAGEQAPHEEIRQALAPHVRGELVEGKAPRVLVKAESARLQGREPLHLRTRLGVSTRCRIEKKRRKKIEREHKPASTLMDIPNWKCSKKLQRKKTITTIEVHYSAKLQK